MLAACSTPPDGVAPGGVHDPYEAQNRKMHAFNREVDRTVLRPIAGSGGAAPEIRQSIGNFGANLNEPRHAVNRLLQGDLVGVGRSTLRFVYNSTLGFGGLFDVAADFGLPADETDFGETLHVWGVPEGAYQELPILGPSTERRTAGQVVDLFLNPLDHVIPKPERYYGTAARIVGSVGERGRFGGSVDSVLYDSADSYAQTRLIYLQNRRFDLQDEEGGIAESDFTDPYEDIHAE
ncbi:MAG: VacJ family lipoprotein [Paracoccaceae bacterium]